MRSLYVIYIFFGLLFIPAQNNNVLKFDSRGEFKILQLTDIHWSGEKKFTDKTTSTFTALLHKEKPDLVVLTGDNVNCIPMQKGWEDLSKIFIAAKVPWTAVFGNHDEEQNWTNRETMAYLKTLPYFLGDAGTVTGDSNFTLPVFSAVGNLPRANLFFLDSGAYTGNPALGHYDWIKRDQITWYSEHSEKLRKEQGKILPGVLFFHIPLMEYALVAKQDGRVGHADEDVSSADVNSGLFAALLEQKNVMATFTGHDHNNNFIGIHQGIALAYGNKTGADGYGDLPAGGRVIILKENQFSFISYITTPKIAEFLFNYPSGLTPITAETPVLKAVNVPAATPGLQYTYYEGEIENTAGIAKLKPHSRGIVKEIGLGMAMREDHYAVKFSGYISVPETAFYKFYTYSDDGSVLKIQDKIVIDNDGGHSAQRKEGIIALEKGLHPIEILYFEDYMGQTLDIGWSSVSLPEESLPGEVLFH